MDGWWLKTKRFRLVLFFPIFHWFWVSFPFRNARSNPQAQLHDFLFWTWIQKLFQASSPSCRGSCWTSEPLSSDHWFIKELCGQCMHHQPDWSLFHRFSFDRRQTQWFIGTCLPFLERIEHSGHCLHFYPPSTGLAPPQKTLFHTSKHFSCFLFCTLLILLYFWCWLICWFYHPPSNDHSRFGWATFLSISIVEPW